MSEENVEIVRRHMDAFNSFMRDELSTEGYGELFDPQIEVRPSRYHGDQWPGSIHCRRGASRASVGSGSPSLGAVVEAHRRLEAGDVIGKLVLQVK